MSVSYVRLTQPADRTVAVFGARQGSGVLLTDRLILTCAHVVRTGSAQVAHPANRDRTRATVAWRDPDLDAALLLVDEPVRPIGPARLGVVDTRQAILECEIIGFPRAQRYGPDRRLEADQYTATVLPMAGRVRDLLVCELDSPPAARPDNEPPALSGLSGGPVFMGDVLLGIARQIPWQREGRRIECVPLSTILAAEPLEQAYRRAGAPLRKEYVHGNFPKDLRYEAEYAQALGVAYHRTKIFGLDELSRHDSEWDLDTAYLSLEAQAKERAAPGPPLPQRIDTLLTDRPRVLLRGEAGAGKTTLLWWLAAHASARTLDDDLAPLNGLVPFVVPLRTLRARGGTFPGPAELSGAADLVVDAAPEGWAGRVLESGRALLLVDGLDEVPPEDREQAHAWLSQLLRRYPETRCMATVRPLAVEPDWLRSEGFAELRLLPMRDEDIQAFVASWHRAARLSEEDDADRLDALEQDLSRQFDQNPTLRDLARTPLLCAVICALHRRRDGLLPETRWKLYRSALEMLLGHRDQRRRIGDPEGIDLSVEEHTQLLQRIAVWLVREGQSEFTREQALRQLGRALAGMDRVSTQGPPERILTHLLNRSGLLREHTDATYQFIHRTFQDYLAAKEFVEDDHLNELLRHAKVETWQDVILLAAGHCGRRELGLLVGGLLDAGLDHGEGSTGRTDLHVLAALCAQHAAWLDSGVRERVRRSTQALFPLTRPDQVDALARLGETVLEFLPDPADVASEGPYAALGAMLITAIGGGRAVPYARAWVLAHPSLNELFAREWDSFPPEEYAAEVLSLCDMSREYLGVRDRQRLKALRHLPALRSLWLGLDATDADMREALEGKRLEHLVLAGNRWLTGLSCLLPTAGSLKYLAVSRCPGIRDLEPLRKLFALESLRLDVSHLSTGRRTIAGTLPAGLKTLELNGLDVDRLSQIAPHHGVEELVLGSRRPLALDILGAWPSLRALEVSALSDPDAAFTALGLRRNITELRFGSFPWRNLGDGTPPLPSIGNLTVPPPRDTEDLWRLRVLFPGLTALELDTSDLAGKLDLTPLHGWPGLAVRLSHNGQTVLIGAEQPDDRLD
ncbi:NACHT domain-containing protein [Streptomyces arboris]|uniref:NACHT domain-containing protein n=1 Tax=Streptomyces arboris TaxID=2600619 RepID=A0A5N5EE18_9ACTN|nr:NACHT domain-containing protein [Streptomyces arboris]KAB2588956.1 NACHT domain-containing protein [Streptomyces arboris]